MHIDSSARLEDNAQDNGYCITIPKNRYQLLFLIVTQRPATVPDARYARENESLQEKGDLLSKASLIKVPINDKKGGNCDC